MKWRRSKCKSIYQAVTGPDKTPSFLNKIARIQPISVHGLTRTGGFVRDWKASEEGKSDLWVFKGDKVFTDVGGTEVPRGYKLDVTRKPMTIEISGEVVQMAGVYALQRDELRICLGPAGKSPTEFNSKGEEHALLVLKRQKP